MIRIPALILGALAASTLNWSAPVHAQPAAAAEQRLGRITIKTIGEGSPVVLIPGLASPAAVYDDLAAHIGPKHRLILVQLNGFAGSAPGAANLDNLLPGAVDELAGWLTANRIKKPAVIGHSMGGLMALMMAKAHPDAAGKLLVVDALPFYGMLFGPGATPDAIRPVVEQMRTGLINGTSPPQVPPHMSNSEAGRAKILEWLKTSDTRTVGEALVEDATTDIRPSLPALAPVPVTVLYAVATTQMKPMADALYAEAYKTLPGVKLVPVEGSEHFIMLDQPARFEEEVENFLR
jgi:Predicted hydrolases or acyltransferases (alpha/beta hydrolase superfamily)